MLRFGVIGTALLAALTGCGGGGGGPQTYPVNGKVVYKGPGDVAKLAGGRVHFETLGEPKVTGSGDLERDGTFTVSCHLDGKDRVGLPAGDYRVCVRPPAEDDGGAARRTGLLHPRFQRFDSAKLKVTVTSGTNTPTIEVEAGR